MFKPKNGDCRDFDIVSWRGRLWMIYITSSETEDENIFGLASSRDGFSWEEEGVIMRPSIGNWDCKSLWAMHLVKTDDGFMLYYSALGQGNRRHQSIGVAYSKDLRNWSRQSQPLLSLSADNPIYSDEIDRIDKWYPNEPAILFRDPWSVASAGRRYLIFAAKDKSVNHQDNACVGLAEIADDNSIKYHQPIYSPGKYHIVECPAIYHLAGKWFLIFCDDIKNEIRYAVSESPLHGFREPVGESLVPAGNYVGRIVDWDGKLLLFYHTADHFLADPKYLIIEKDKIIIQPEAVS